MSVFVSIKKLVNYALDKKLIPESEKIYSTNLLLDVLNLDSFEEVEEEVSYNSLEEILSELLEYAISNHLIEDSIVDKDLFDTRIMNCFTPRPQTVIETFEKKYQESPSKATSWYYQFSKDSDYVRSYRIVKDIKWKVSTKYGNIDITINLSKPEKDPKAIAAAKNAVQSAYPKCQLCQENEGYRGRINHPARETLRIIPLSLDGDPFFLQFSPYSYFNEHCIVFNKEHVPMVIDEKALRHLLSFVEQFPHYILGSNADLPIVGGSILTHDHYQGGNYIFPMFCAESLFTFSINGYQDVKCSYLKWPLSVIRVQSKDKEKVLSLALKILNSWRTYTDEKAFIFADTDGEKHNTISPICHKIGDEFAFDLALRNNITTPQHPLGFYHPHEELWNIKKENIGLIEVMGLAILPSRLKKELQILEELILAKKDISKDETCAKHASWVASFLPKYDDINRDNIHTILRDEVGHTFIKVLECAGVYKQDEEGKQGVLRFIESLNR